MIESKQDIGVYRSTARYCAVDFILTTSLIATSKAIGYYNLVSHNGKLYDKTINGNNDLFYKAEHNYHRLDLTMRVKIHEDLCNAFKYDIWKNIGKIITRYNNESRNKTNIWSCVHSN